MLAKLKRKSYRKLRNSRKNNNKMFKTREKHKKMRRHCVRESNRRPRTKSRKRRPTKRLCKLD